ncbi:peptidase U32 family protein [Thiorhodococcus minor]|uniref:U32 family peptidase n=1 Tax=Thiorhodococcus minor TaxID=57489 RepID=A0A6M0K2I4_9GAMM|nr:peptidase U32 family protein [Thiorhodococcus minor]NEV63930.1 U32 family peptidase [Thiorhodococcus minor]
MARPTILAPAGRLEMARAAVDAGADSLYVGPLGWSRRPYESEMGDADIRRAIDYAGARGADVRILLNTFPSPFEYDAWLDAAERYADWGCSGFILSDPGAIPRLRARLPQAVLHVSVGSGISNAEDAAFYRALGADLIVVPYRWGEAQVQAVRAQSDIGVEVFLFETVQTGKLCPGRCIMSSYLKFRDWTEMEGRDAFHGSANRGAKECYRVCQTRWDFGPIDVEQAAPSLKLRRDAQLMLEQIPGMISAGVRCFKLSGRERPTPIIRDLVAFYRRVIDGVLDGACTDMAAYAEEMRVLEHRWVSEKRKRVGTLMGRAVRYGEATQDQVAEPRQVSVHAA